MALRALRAAVLVLLPSLALAQTGTVTLTPSQVNQADCAGTGSISVRWTSAFATNDTFRLVADSSCPTSPPAQNGAKTLRDDVPATSSPQSQSVTIDSIGNAVTADCAAINDTTVKVCVYLIAGGGSGSSSLVNGADFTFQTAVPPAPVNVSARPGNKAIEVSFSAATKSGNYQADSLEYEVEYKPAGGTFTSNGRSATSPVRISGLTNLETYTVRVYAWSAANPLVGNRSPASAEASATPLPFDDYWTRYKDAGGREQGGCGAAGAGALAPLLLALAVFLRRRA